MSIARNAQALWKGAIKSGNGQISTPASGALKNLPFSFVSRFENEKGIQGTNPEELIAAAHAGCFSMALSATLGSSNITPDHINTNATLTMVKDGTGFTIKKIHLDVQAKVPGIDQKALERFVTTTKDTCPVSRLLKAEITVASKLTN